MDKFSFLQCQFIASAFEEDQFPKMMTDPRGNLMPEIAIVGRSNVGKSSLINSLFNNKKLAKTSSTPGKTQSVNFFSVDNSLSLVDLPGYGYAKVPGKTKEKWSVLIESYLKTRESLRLILFLIDSRRTPTQQDSVFMQWATGQRIPLLLIFTKADKITPHEKRESALNCLNEFQRFLHDSPIRFLHYSTKDPGARNVLIQQINACMFDPMPRKNIN